MKRIATISFLALLSVASLRAATIEVRQQGGGSQFQAEIASKLNMEVVIDTQGEEITGYSFFLSFPSADIRLVAENPEVPFTDVPFVEGIVLVNVQETIGDETILSFTKASGATGDQRQTANAAGVAARFEVEVVRRPIGDLINLSIEERGHDRVSHYVSAAMPGTEQRFATPLGGAEIEVFGFRILPLPDVLIIEGETQEVFDLDTFVDQPGAEVIWINSNLSEIPTVIDRETNLVTMAPRAGFTGRRGMIFTATEVGDRLVAADTVSIDVISRPKITSFPDSVVFAEDTSNHDLDLDGFVVDLDDADESLRWQTSAGTNIQVVVNESRGVSFTASPDYFGREQVRFTVTDSRDLVAVDSTTVIVTPVNDPPDTRKVPPVYPIAAVQNGVLQVSHAPGFFGLAAVLLTVHDPDQNQRSALLAVEVLRPEDDLGPRIQAPPAIRMATNAEIVLVLDDLVADPDQQPDALQWSSFVSEGLQLVFEESTRDITLRSGSEDRLGALTLTVTDGQGSDTAVIPVLILSSGADPLVREIPALALDSLRAEAQLDLDDFVADDEDSTSELLWEVQADPGIEAEIDPVSHQLTIRRVPAGDVQSSVAQVLLKVVDTSGQETSVVLQVGLPPTFGLTEIPDIEIFAGGQDTSLVLDAFVDGQARNIQWEVESGRLVQSTLSADTNRLRLTAPDPSSTGSETLLITATDGTGRSRSVTVRVIVKGRGLIPQIRPFNRIEIAEGASDSLDLDDFVVDDDADSLLIWSFSGQTTLTVTIDSLSHVVSLNAEGSEPGLEQIQFLVRDPLGNVALAPLEVAILRGGKAPVLRPIPQLLIPAGVAEESLLLDLFVIDEDTPIADISWEVSTGPGVAARLEGSLLLLSIPAGSTGTRSIAITATDPQGNSAVGNLQIVIQGDSAPPQFALQIGRHPVFSDFLEIAVKSSESLRQNPDFMVDETAVPVEQLADETEFRGIYSFPSQPGERVVGLNLRGFDRAGNEGALQQLIALRWMDAAGGRLNSPDLQLLLNVPNAAAGPGNLALVYRLPESEVPPGSEGRPVYFVDLNGEPMIGHPVSLNFLAPPQALLGVLRWDDVAGVWEELPTTVDSDSGRLSVAVDKLSLFRLGTVGLQSRTMLTGPKHFPNPFSSTGPSMKIIYNITQPGKVKLEIFNLLGQRVRLLVDEPQDIGVWSAAWDGKTSNGDRLASGIYFYSLRANGNRMARTLLLIR